MVLGGFTSSGPSQNFSAGGLGRSEREGGFAGANNAYAREVANQVVDRMMGTNFSAGRQREGGNRGLAASTRDGGFGSTGNAAAQAAANAEVNALIGSGFGFGDRSPGLLGGYGLNAGGQPVRPVGAQALIPNYNPVYRQSEFNRFYGNMFGGTPQEFGEIAFSQAPLMGKYARDASGRYILDDQGNYIAIEPSKTDLWNMKSQLEESPDLRALGGSILEPINRASGNLAPDVTAIPTPRFPVDPGPRGVLDAGNVAQPTVPDAPTSPSVNVDDFMMRRAREFAQRQTAEAPAPISQTSGTPMSGADAEVARLGLLGDNFGMSSFEQAAPVTTPSNEIVSVRDTGKGYNVVEFADGHTEVRTGARNWRNNNPGNIEYGSFAKSMGAIGSDGRFAIFPTYDAGRAAKESLLFDTSSYKNKTISEAINRYAPPSENNTNAYIGGITSALGVPSNTPLSSLSPAQRSAMLDAMERIEGFRVGNVQSSGAPNAVDATQLAASNALASGGLLGGNTGQFAQTATPTLPPRTPTPEQTAVNQAVTPGLPPRTPTPPPQQVADAVTPAAPPMAPSGRLTDTIPVRTDRQPAVIETPIQDAIGNTMAGLLGVDYNGYPNAGSARLGWDTVLSEPTPYNEEAGFFDPGNLFPYAKDVNPIEGTPEGQYIQQTETGPLKGYIDVPYRYEAMDKPVYGAPGVPDGWTAPVKGASVITFKDGGGVWKHPTQGWQSISQFRGDMGDTYKGEGGKKAQREVQVASELNADEAATTGSTTDTASSMLPQWYLDWLASQGRTGGILG